MTLRVVALDVLKLGCATEGCIVPIAVSNPSCCERVSKHSKGADVIGMAGRIALILGGQR